MSTLDTDHPKIIGLGRSKNLATPLSFLIAAVGPRRSPPQAAREAAQGGNGGQSARRREGGAAAKGGGASASTKRGGAFYPPFPSTRQGATARAAAPTPRSGGGAVKLVGRRAPRYHFTARRAHYTTTPRHKTRPRRIVALWARKCQCGQTFFARAGRVVRELFLICIKIRRSRLRGQLLPLRRQASYSTSPRHKGRGIALAWYRVLMSRAQQAGHMARP